MNIFLVIFLIILIINIILIIFANYFCTYALKRSGSGGNRKIKTKENIKENSEKKLKDEESIKNEKIKQEDETNKWKDKIKDKTKILEINAFDGIKLCGSFYENDNNYKNYAIVLHGYRADEKSVEMIAKSFYDQKYNVLVPSMRACDKSQGDYIGMGALDSYDLLEWIDYILKQEKDAKIILHGSSMGAATVLMVSDKIPSNVKAIIEDSGYTTIANIFKSEAKARFNLPSFPFIYLFGILVKLRAKYDIRTSALKSVKNSKVPILFIHGTKDDFVPLYMCNELYDIKEDKKEKLIIDNANHVEAKYVEPDKYYKTIKDFCSKYIN